MGYGWLTFGVAVITLVLLRERPPTPPDADSAERHSFAKGIAHILKLIPYKKVPRDKVKLPKRSMKGEYDDQATLKGRSVVPQRY